MKIAIFGDSFGDDYINWKDKNRWLDVGPSWVDYLRQYHDVDNQCQGGSSLYAAKRKFDNYNLSQYDKVIFLTTDPKRRFQIWPGDSLEGSNWNFSNVEKILKNNTHPFITEQLVAMDLFFKHIFNESDLHFHSLMIEDIKRKCSTGYIIDVGFNSVIGNVSVNEIANNMSLLQIFDQGLSDARKCHMSEENNLIFGQHLNNCLLNNCDPIFNKNMFVKQTRSFNHYFRKNEL